jgi:hypothetical protein|nr:MAG TPA_asm: hypothetical protein [Caudoviricetes sp.]
MRILYRDHRGSIAEAMETIREYRTVDEMKAGIAADCNKLHREVGFIGEAFSAEDISIGDNIGADDRIGWTNTHYVCIRRLGDEDFEVPQAIGFCTFIN